MSVRKGGAGGINTLVSRSYPSSALHWLNPPRRQRATSVWDLQRSTFWACGRVEKGWYWIWRKNGDSCNCLTGSLAHLECCLCSAASVHAALGVPWAPCMKQLILPLSSLPLIYSWCYLIPNHIVPSKGKACEVLQFSCGPCIVRYRQTFKLIHHTVQAGPAPLIPWAPHSQGTGVESVAP